MAVSKMLHARIYKINRIHYCNIVFISYTPKNSSLWNVTFFAVGFSLLHRENICQGDTVTSKHVISISRADIIMIKKTFQCRATIYCASIQKKKNTKSEIAYRILNLYFNFHVAIADVVIANKNKSSILVGFRARNVLIRLSEISCTISLQ